MRVRDRDVILPAYSGSIDVSMPPRACGPVSFGSKSERLTVEAVAHWSPRQGASTLRARTAWKPVVGMGPFVAPRPPLGPTPVRGGPKNDAHGSRIRPTP